MRSFFKRLFINNWQRKVVSLILAMIIWMIVNHVMTTTKTFSDIPVKLINIPPGKTVEGLQTNNILSKRIALTLTGNKNVIDELSNSDLEVIIDASAKGNEWIATINKKNLVSFNPDVDLSKNIQKISHHDFIVKLSKLVTERIPILVTKPIGEAPKGYQFLDVWPYQLYINVSGPESVVKQLKNKGLKLTFNLQDISKTELDQIQLQEGKNKDEVSFFVPNAWKKISLPFLSDAPIEIDDPRAKYLRIDFVKTALLPLPKPIAISVFYPEKYLKNINPKYYSLATNAFVKEVEGVFFTNFPLYAQQVSRLFVDIVKDRLSLVLIASPKQMQSELLWNVQFVYPSDLEDLYVAKIIAESTNGDKDMLQPHLREEYLRNRFRNYMTEFRLYTEAEQKLSLRISLQGHNIVIEPTVPVKKENQ